MISAGLIDSGVERIRTVEDVAVGRAPDIAEVGPDRRAGSIEVQRLHRAGEQAGRTGLGQGRQGIDGHLHFGRADAIVARIGYAQRVEPRQIDRGRKGISSTENVAADGAPLVGKVRTGIGTCTVQAEGLHGTGKDPVETCYGQRKGHSVGHSRRCGGRTAVVDVLHLQGVGAGCIDQRVRAIGAAEDVPIGRRPRVLKFRPGAAGAAEVQGGDRAGEFLPRTGIGRGLLKVFGNQHVSRTHTAVALIRHGQQVRTRSIHFRLQGIGAGENASIAGSPFVQKAGAGGGGRSVEDNDRIVAVQQARLTGVGGRQVLILRDQHLGTVATTVLFVGYR